MKKRQKIILEALEKLGGKATTRQIAEKTGLHVNGVSQSLSALSKYVEYLGGRGGEIKWKLRKKISRLMRRKQPQKHEVQTLSESEFADKFLKQWGTNNEVRNRPQFLLSKEK